MSIALPGIRSAVLSRLYSYAFDRVCVIAQGRNVNFAKTLNSKLALPVTVQVQAEVATIKQ